LEDSVAGRYRRRPNQPPTGPFYGPLGGDPQYWEPRTPPKEKHNPLVRVVWAVGDVCHYAWISGVWCYRHRIELTPAAAGAAVFVGGLELYAQHHLTFTTLGLLLSEGIGWKVSGSRYGRDRAEDGKLPEKLVYARALITAITGWLLAAVLFGPTHEGVVIAFFAMGLPLAYPWWKHRLPRRKAKNPVLDHWRAEWWKIRDLPNLYNQLYGTDVIAAEGDMEYPELTVETAYGVGDAESIVKASALIEAALKLKANTVRIELTDDRRQVKVFIRRIEALDQAVGWDDAELPTSAREPVILGRHERGGLLRVVLRGTHTYLIGQTQWGKSNELNVILKSLTATYDTLIFVIDLKGGSFALPWARCIDWPATTVEEALLMMDDVNRMIDNRGSGYAGRKAMVGTPDVPHIVVIFDEAAEGLGSRGSPALQRKWESFISRGAGEEIFAAEATQEGSLDSTGNSKIRVNHANYLAFHSQYASDGKYGLVNYTKLDVSRIDRKGGFYYHGQSVTPGINGDHEDLVRGPLIRGTRQDGPADEYVKDIADAHWDRRPVLDAITARGLRHYHGRWHRQTPEMQKAAGVRVIDAQSSPAPQQPAYAHAGAGSDPRMESPVTSPGYETALDRARAAEAEAYEFGGDISAAELGELRASGQLDALLSQSPISGTMDQFAFDLASAGREGARPVDLRKKPNPGPDEPARLARSTVHQKLGDLIKQGLVEQLPTGNYRATGWENPVEAFQAIQAELRTPAASSTA
jgi:hypothetical protein